MWNRREARLVEATEIDTMTAIVIGDEDATKVVISEYLLMCGNYENLALTRGCFDNFLF